MDDRQPFAITLSWHLFVKELYRYGHALLWIFFVGYFMFQAGVIVVVDHDLRKQRDTACETRMFVHRLQPEKLPHVQWDLMQVPVENTIHFYGCDDHGTTYRYWYEEKEK